MGTSRVGVVRLCWVRQHPKPKSSLKAPRKCSWTAYRPADVQRPAFSRYISRKISSTVRVSFHPG